MKFDIFSLIAILYVALVFAFHYVFNVISLPTLTIILLVSTVVIVCIRKYFL